MTGALLHLVRLLGAVLSHKLTIELEQRSMDRLDHNILQLDSYRVNVNDDCHQ